MTSIQEWLRNDERAYQSLLNEQLQNAAMQQHQDAFAMQNAYGSLLGMTGPIPPPKKTTVARWKDKGWTYHPAASHDDPAAFRKRMEQRKHRTDGDPNCEEHF